MNLHGVRALRRARLRWPLHWAGHVHQPPLRRSAWTRTTRPPRAPDSQMDLAAGLPDIAAGLLTLFQSVCHAMKLRQQQVLLGYTRFVRQPYLLPCPRQHPVALPAWTENHKCVWSHAGAPSFAGIASVLSWPSPPTTTKTSCRSAPIAGQVFMASRGSPRWKSIYDHAQYRR